MKPLHGLSIAVTRAPEQEAELSARLRALGARVVSSPAIRIVPTRPRRVPKADVVIFTSVNGVACYFDLPRRLRHLPDKKVFVATIGPATAAALRKHGVRVNLTAGRYTSDDLARELAPHVKGKMVLHAGADKTNPDVGKYLKKRGARFLKLTLYIVGKPGRIPFAGADLVTFASAQTARNFASKVKARPPAACIGPVTTAAANKLGYKVVVQPHTFTIPGLVKAIKTWARTRRSA